MTRIEAIVKMITEGVRICRASGSVDLYHYDKEKNTIINGPDDAIMSCADGYEIYTEPKKTRKVAVAGGGKWFLKGNDTKHELIGFSHSGFHLVSLGVFLHIYEEPQIANFKLEKVEE